MKTLYGMHRPEEGTITVDAKAGPLLLTDRRHRRRHRHGAPALHARRQPHRPGERRLGAEPTRGVALDFAAARRRITELSDTYKLGIRPDVLVERLGVGERQRVEILKVLYRGARILILDEPTAVLVPQEVTELFGNLEELTAEGVTVIFISHKLDEVLSVADTITVIRAGTTVGTVKPADVTSRQLAEMMVGSELPTPETRESTVTDVVALEVRDLTVRSDGRTIVDDISFAIRKGRSSASPASRATVRPSSSTR
jgi:simple sugar transport system ATP-binding protein